jgi:hypothetical protein
VYLLPQAKEAALAWQTARQEVYGFLHEHHRNLAPHAMLRRMIELAAIEDTLPPNFLDMTDDAALDCLAGNIHQGVAMLGQRVRAGAAAWHVCHWEAELPPEAAETLLRGSWQRRAELEAKLADEAGLAPQDVIVEVLISAAGRSLPPISSSGKPDGFLWLPVPHSTPPIAHLLVTAGTPRDYAHRLRTAAERHLGALGAIPRAFTARRRESSCDESRTSR